MFFNDLSKGFSNFQRQFFLKVIANIVFIVVLIYSCFILIELISFSKYWENICVKTKVIFRAYRKVFINVIHYQEFNYIWFFVFGVNKVINFVNLFLEFIIFFLKFFICCIMRSIIVNKYIFEIIKILRFSIGVKNAFLYFFIDIFCYRIFSSILSFSLHFSLFIITPKSIHNHCIF